MRKPTRFTRPIAILALMSFGAAACGLTPAEDSAESATATASSDIELGTSLEEWADDEGLSQRPTPIEGERSGDSEINPAYVNVEWGDLIPEGLSPEEVWDSYDDEFATLEFGSDEEQALYETVQAEIDHDVVEESLDGQDVRLAGFVAPLTYDDDIVTEFLLVPFFGACIHLPAPPPNQTVLVNVDKEHGFTIEETYGAIWVEGTLDIERADTDLAAASYALTGINSGIFE